MQLDQIGARGGGWVGGVGRGTGSTCCVAVYSAVALARTRGWTRRGGVEREERYEERGGREGGEMQRRVRSLTSALVCGSDGPVREMSPRVRVRSRCVGVRENER